MKKIFLIFSDSPDDYADIKGVVIGTEEDAVKCCGKYNSGSEHEYDFVDYRELEILT